MFGAFYFGQPFFAGSTATQTLLSGNGFGTASASAAISGSASLSIRGQGWSRASVTLVATGSLSGSGSAPARGSVSLYGPGALAGTGIGTSGASGSPTAGLFFSAKGLAWSLSSSTGSQLIIARIAGLGFCYALPSVSLLPAGLIRVPQDLRPGDFVHYQPRGCAGDTFTMVLALSADRTQIKLRFLGTWRWVWTRDIVSAVRPTFPDSRLPTAIIDPVGFRTKL